VSSLQTKISGGRTSATVTVLCGLSCATPAQLSSETILDPSALPTRLTSGRRHVLIRKQLTPTTDRPTGQWRRLPRFNITALKHPPGHSPNINTCSYQFHSTTLARYVELNLHGSLQFLERYNGTRRYLNICYILSFSAFR